MNAAASIPTVWMPGDPPRPCPPLLTQREAAILLRLDTTDTRFIDRAFERYASMGFIRATRIGRTTLYRLVDLLDAMEDFARVTPRERKRRGPAKRPNRKSPNTVDLREETLEKLRAGT